ncbi:unnamed protein product [Tuber aestivum]|uniref:Uncharacterized protein n=1 Tax=Tuber aestivum TaxID=59557 RepID=A0A292PMQ3_9PEZI|nr:unnamed protein product [Tuber aestivum]
MASKPTAGNEQRAGDKEGYRAMETEWANGRLKWISTTDINAVKRTGEKANRRQSERVTKRTGEQATKPTGDGKRMDNGKRMHAEQHFQQRLEAILVEAV